VNRNQKHRAVRCPAAFILIVCASLCSASVLAESTPLRGAFDSRVRTAVYNADEVYKLRGFVGYQIDLEFEPGEIFTGLGAGDLDAVSFVGQENHLFLKPRAASVATNLTVLTSKRHYQIDYTALAQKPAADDAGVIYALRFTYPPSAAQAAADAALRRVDTQLDNASDSRPRNLDYWYCGEPSIKPVAVSDDGVHTRLKFAANAELPALFVRNEDGSESLLNFSMESGDVIVHRIARRFIVRRGRLTGCVVNRGFVGGGTRLDSGTVAPDVQRRIQGAVK
jgi:type IV secretion system protein VirB9